MERDASPQRNAGASDRPAVPSRTAGAPKLPAYLAVYAALLVLLCLTVAVAQVPMGGLNMVLSLAVATGKALLVALYFMHLRYSSRLTWVFAGAGCFWLCILFALTASDYVSRDWLPGK